MKILGIMSAGRSLLMAVLISMLTACGGGEDNDTNNLVISKTSYINAQGTQDSIFSDGQGNMSVNTIFKLTFSGDLNEKYINGSNIVLHNMNSHKQVNAKVEYDAASRTVTLLPVTLEYENHYMIRIVNAITDVNGNKLRDGKIEFSFFTEAKPALFLQEPINGATEISSRASVRVTFDKPMDVSTINTETFYLLEPSGIKISGTVKMEKDTAIFTPLVELGLSQQYNAVLSSSIRNQNGGAFSGNDVYWSFTTKAVRSSTLHVASEGNDSINAVGIDSLNNMYVAGNTNGSLNGAPNMGDNDAFIAKYSNIHGQLWIAQLGSIDFDTITHLTTDTLNDVYVVGYTDGSIDGITQATMSDIFVAKYSSTGQRLWITQFGADAGHDMSHGIVILNNKIYAAGSTSGAFAGQTSAGEHDFFIAEFDMQTGVKNWIQQFGSTGDDHVAGLGADALGNLIVSVNTRNFDPNAGSVEPDSYVKIYAYTPTAFGVQEAWQSTDLKAEFLSYELRGFSIVANNIYVSGERNPSFHGQGPIILPPPDLEQQFGSFVAKYDSASAGVKVWDKSFDRNNFNVADSMVVDASENIYLAGSTFGDPIPFPGSGAGGPFPIFGPPKETISVRQYNSNGDKLWNAEIKSAGHARVKSLVLDNQGIIHVAGDAHGSVDGNSLIGEGDGFIAKINSLNGQVQ